jgi:MerR family transcriptional regulator, light-induced transcriptional regulator
MAESIKNNQVINSLIKELRTAMDAGDSPAAVKSALRAIDEKSVSVTGLYLDCLTPILAAVGDEWQAGSRPIWREHAASAVCRDIIGAMAPEISRIAPEAAGKTVVLACPPEEQHDLGLRMIADLYRLNGWQSCFLGADTPVIGIIAAAKETGAETVVLSAATHYTLINIDDVVSAIAGALPDIKIMLTGPAYKDRPSAPAAAELLDPASLIPPTGTA